jgi:hypothetical protein
MGIGVDYLVRIQDSPTFHRGIKVEERTVNIINGVDGAYKI